MNGAQEHGAGEGAGSQRANEEILSSQKEEESLKDFELESALMRFVF